jgi:23S rRNA pseudouridine2605 synthase
MQSKSDDKDKPTAQSGQRIAKVMARAGLASRREAEGWIAAGRVAINGAVITSPAVNVGARDRVTVDGKRLPQAERTRLFLFHKPRGLVTTTADPEGRPTIFGALPKNLPRLVTVGRLDLNTEGLLLLTNDGGLARVLEHPSTGWLRRYRVRARGSVTQAQLDGLRNGITVEGIRYGPIEATMDRTQGANTWLTFAIREGKNREVRNVLGALDLQVNRLIRVSFGPFQLAELAEGAIEEVRTRVLRDQLGSKIAEQADIDLDAPVTQRDDPAAEHKPKVRQSDWRKGEEHRRAPSRDDSEKPGKPRPWRGHGRNRPIVERAEESGAPRKTKAGLLTDRKGRRVLVQRVQPEPPVAAERPPPRGRAARKPTRDRRHGPRPSRPASAGKDERK